jgi:CRISPR-associated protein Cas1
MTAGGAYLGKLSSGRSHNIELRLAQFQRFSDPDYLLDLARRHVRGKLANMRALLGRSHRADPSSPLPRALVALRRAQEQLGSAATLDEIRGYEGHGSAEYFKVFGTLLRNPELPFERRLRRPPPDPVNILLSLGYTLLGNLVQGYTELVGLDPYLGALHAPERGRPSLALDLIEEWRPTVVDAAIVRVVNTREIQAADFARAGDEEAPVEDQWEREEAERGEVEPTRRVAITQAGIRKWLTAYERRLAELAHYPRLDVRLSYRQIIREQVNLLARHIRGEEEYQPFIRRD